MSCEITVDGLAVFAPGNKVRFTDDEKSFVARVTATTISGSGHVRHEVVWFSNGERKEAWVEASELVPA